MFGRRRCRQDAADRRRRPRRARPAPNADVVDQALPDAAHRRPWPPPGPSLRRNPEVRYRQNGRMGEMPDADPTDRSEVDPVLADSSGLRAVVAKSRERVTAGQKRANALIEKYHDRP